AAAIRVAPAGKLLFGLVALLPVTVQQLASLSPDASNIPAAFLLTALLLRAAVAGAPSGWRLVGAAAGLTLWLAACKLTLARLVLLALAVPGRTLGWWGRYLAAAAVVAAAVLLAAFALLVWESNGPPGPRDDMPAHLTGSPAPDQASPGGQLVFLRVLGNTCR